MKCSILLIDLSGSKRLCIIGLYSYNILKLLKLLYNITLLCNNLLVTSARLFKRFNIGINQTDLNIESLCNIYSRIVNSIDNLTDHRNDSRKNQNCSAKCNCTRAKARSSNRSESNRLVRNLITAIIVSGVNILTNALDRICSSRNILNMNILRSVIHLIVYNRYFSVVFQCNETNRLRNESRYTVDQRRCQAGIDKLSNAVLILVQIGDLLSIHLKELDNLLHIVKSYNELLSTRLRRRQVHIAERFDIGIDQIRILKTLVIASRLLNLREVNGVVLIRNELEHVDHYVVSNLNLGSFIEECIVAMINGYTSFLKILNFSFCISQRIHLL
nr:MAG TPA: hypothetical protein [Caudoviricetes sp.]